MERRIYRLMPAAAEDDSHWDRAENRGEVVVRADSAADARIIASEAETGLPDIGPGPGPGVEARFASAFRDDKLYAVIEDDGSGFPAEGPRGVLSAAFLHRSPVTGVRHKKPRVSHWTDRPKGPSKN